MREILFRGKRVRTDENGIFQWVYGYFCSCALLDNPPQIIDSDGRWFDVDPSTVGQFTGLYDAAGTHIFEGDIVANYDPEERRAAEVGFPISYLDAGFGVKYQTTPPLYHVLERRDCEYYVVIGNVHDSPELVAEGMTP